MLATTEPLFCRIVSLRYWKVFYEQSRETSTDDNDCYQFGYKSGHSTGRLCIKIMKKLLITTLDMAVILLACLLRQ